MKNYWSNLTTAHKWLLVIGLIVGLPVALAVIVIAGLYEASRFLVRVQL